MEINDIDEPFALFQTKQFLLLSSIQFLCLIEKIVSPQQSSESMPFIELSPRDVDCYKALKNGQKELTAALKLSKKRSSGGDEL